MDRRKSKMVRRTSRRARILIIEDDEDLRRMVRHALSLAQYDVQEAGNGLHALRILDADPPDLVILDLGLPLISGNMVRVELAAHAHTRDIPVIVITGSVGDHDLLQVACVVQKPFDIDRLMITVSACIRVKAPVQRRDRD
jgi:two-component system KDP operon response regulator KdpE